MADTDAGHPHHAPAHAATAASDKVRVQINPKAVNLQGVTAGIPSKDVLREKAQVVKVTKKEPVEVSAEGAAALKEAGKLAGIDANGGVVEGVIDALPDQPAPQQAGGDMTAKDLEAGGKKPATK